jgi:SPP1 gp7 family putative phage head morphogenesis protein
MAARKDTTIRQPSQRVFTTWTPALLKTAFLNAEAGNVRLASELCDNMLADDRINTVYDTRIGGLLGLELQFEASSSGRRRNMAVRALEADEDWWAMFPESELWPLLVWGRHFGISFGQLHPTDHEGRTVPRLEFWHPRNTRFDWNTRQWLALTEPGTGPREVPITPGDGQWIAYSPYGAYRPWASGLWRGLARWWLLKSFAQDDAGRRSEKSGTTIVEDSLEGNDPVEARQLRKDIASDMAAAARDAVVVLPSGFKASLLESKDSIQANQGTIIDMANSAIAIAVLGQNLTTEVAGGSYAAATVHSKVQIQRIRSDGETASTTLHNQALEWWAEYNFGSTKLAPWPIWRTDPPTDQVSRATVLSTLATALNGLKAVGFTISKEDIETDFDVELVDLPPEEMVTEPLEPPDPNDPEAGEPPDPENPTEQVAEMPPVPGKPGVRSVEPFTRATGKKKLSREERHKNSPQPPEGPITAYQSDIRALVKRWWAKAGPEALAKAEEITKPQAETRANESDADIGLTDYSSMASEPMFVAQVSRAAKAVGAHNTKEFKRIGIPLSKSDPGVSKMVPAFRKENVGLVGTMLDDEKRALEELLADGAGRSIESLSADIEERFGITSRHADLIAADQCLKLNADVAHERMARAGITEFVWTTAGDERVRTSHDDLDGETFSFDDPPVTNEDGDTNLPGGDFQCRCVSYPIVPELDDEADSSE